MSFFLPLPPFFCMCGGVKRLWICSVTAKEPRVSVRVGVCGPGSKHESRGDGGAGRIKGIRGRDWERLIKARRRRFFNEQLDPISRGQQQPSKSPPTITFLLCQCSPPPLQKPPYRLRLSVSTIPLTALSTAPPALATCGWKPSDTGSNLATPAYVKSSKKGGGSHAITRSRAHKTVRALFRHRTPRVFPLAAALGANI